MSPLSLRRYRAERLLRAEFERLRGRVIASVRGRLGAPGASLDASDLEACYAQAWQGLYAAMLEGQEIANPTGWLTLVTFRRAIEELRGRRALRNAAAVWATDAVRPRGPAAAGAEGAAEPDFAAELDDRIALRQLLEGLCGRLSAREREAAVLCYLQGLSRSEAAARMGISDSRMRKLMDGHGVGRPGVAHKVGALAETIKAGAWCEEQGSLMRGLAYGMLDPDGERYRLALIHRGECPACRAYVLSLRGLAAVLPPVLAPWGLAAQALSRAGPAAHVGAGIGAHPAGTAPAGAVCAGGQASSPVAGALSVSGAAGAGGAAGGSWLWAGGSLGTKVAVGCLLALGVGAGCVGFSAGVGHRRNPLHTGASAGIRAHPSLRGYAAPANVLRGYRSAEGARGVGRTASGTSLSPTPTPAARAAREFGPERGSVAGAGQQSSPSAGPPSGVTLASSAGRAGARDSTSPGSASKPPAPVARSQSPTSSAPPATAGARSAAEREFGIE